MAVPNPSASGSGSMGNHNKDWSWTSPGKAPGHPMQETDSREFICGWGASAINICMTFPINKVMFRQQLHGISTMSSFRQLRAEGLFNLYRGLLPPLLQKTTALALMFGLYDQFQKVIYQQSPTLPLLLNKAIAANLAGCVETVLTPFERIQTLLQDKHYQKKFRNTTHAFVELRSYGVKEYFRGSVPILIRNGPSNMLFFLLRGELKGLLPKAKSSSGELVADFVSGGVLGALISTAFFPVNVVKTRMQAQLGGEYTGFVRTFWIVFEERERSWRKMFSGVHVNYTRSLISWGIINASYEVLRKALYSY